jgi:hypothetical protein
MSAHVDHHDKQAQHTRNIPRSKGWVTQAAILLALPPNQKGYRIVAFFASAVAFAGVAAALGLLMVS